MKKNTLTLLIFFVAIMFSLTSYSQDVIYSTITKNFNKDAKSLSHSLSPSGDMLHLKSEFVLLRAEIFSENDMNVFKVENSKKEIDISLASVPVGDYTVAVFHVERNDEIYQYQKTIVFRISRLLPITILDEEQEMLASVEPDEIPVPNNVDKLLIANKKLVSRAARLNKKAVTTNKVALTNNALDLKKLKGNAIVTPEETVDTNRNKKLKVYNISDDRDGAYVIQTRAEYRRNNLRPNGTPYD